MTVVRGEPVFSGIRYASGEYLGVDGELLFPHPFTGVSLTAPSVTVTGSPTRMEWVFEAPLDPNVEQVEYWVQVKLAGVVVIDSGWQKSANQWAYVDLAAAGIGDVSDVEFLVSAHQSDRGHHGSDSTTLDVTLGQPVVSFIEPDPGSVDYMKALVACRWDYHDSQGKPQAKSRVRLYLGQQLLWTSHWEANVDHHRDIPYLLFDGTRYRVGLTVRNSEGVESVGVT